MKKTFNFGKIKYISNRRVNAVEITVELRNRGGEATFTVDRKTGIKTYTGNVTPEYVELSICGTIWNATHTDCVCGGQCLDTIAMYRNQLSDPELFDTIYDYWKRYHLNGTHAGTPEQEAAVAEWKAEGNRYTYPAACEMLKARGLYEVNYTGLSVGRRYENEPYKYGHGWLIQQLPGDVLVRIEHMLSA